MISLWLAVLLFGFMHAGAKILVGLGLNTAQICLAFVGIRLLFQVVWNFHVLRCFPYSKKSLLTLALFGLFGVGLQYFEFAGLEHGLPVATVSFLVYSHPVWSVTLATVAGKARLLYELPRLLLAIVGVGLIVGIDGSVGWNVAFIYPLIAGVFLAAWIYMSKYTADLNYPPKVVSFYYDLFALLFFLVVFSQINLHQDLDGLFELMKDGETALIVTAYSIVIGYAPNVLFYKGSKSAKTALISGYLLLLEPVFSVLYGYLIFDETFGPSFFLGAGLLLLCQLDRSQIQLISKHIRRR